jgi:hypothetical protein
VSANRTNSSRGELMTEAYRRELHVLTHSLLPICRNCRKLLKRSSLTSDFFLLPCFVGAIFEALKTRPRLFGLRYGVFEPEPSGWEASESDGQGREAD